MKKQVSLFLCFLMLFPTLAGCSEQKNEDDKKETTPIADSNETSGDAQVTETEAETTEEDVLSELYEDLPKADYSGFKFGFLNNESNFANTMMTAEELTGEGINDAVFNRNQKVSDDLNITIVEYLKTCGDVSNAMKTSIAAGDQTYSAFWNESHMLAPFAVNGELANVNDISTLNLDKPWWEGGIHEEVTFGDYLYFLVGDVHLMFKESFWMCGFNRDLLNKLDMTDPYEQVREGTWTIDALKADIDGALLDLDGNGLYDGYDQFGVTCYDGCFNPLFYGMGEDYIGTSEDGSMIFKIPGDKFYSVYDKITETIFKNDAACVSGKTKNISQYQDEWHGVFSSGHSLFYLEPIGSLKKLRDMEAEFGIVPYPKYDEAQEDYHTLIAHYAAFCGIPASQSLEGLERTGVILENLCARSYVDLRNAYVEDTLNFKYIRDKESAEMLNIILSTGTVNISALLDCSEYPNNVMQQSFNGKAEITSMVDRFTKSANKKLERNIQKLIKAE